MEIKEFVQIKDLSYFGYCHYLLNKYGAATMNYFTPNGGKNKVTRTKERLYCHHIYEDRAPLLSTPEYAEEAPAYYQDACNLVYCDILEHLFLHVKIAKESLDRKDYANPCNPSSIFGIGGVIDYIVPELIDYYAGWKPKKEWQINCLKVCDNNYVVFLEILKYYRKHILLHPLIDDPNYDNEVEESMFTSFNEQYGSWASYKNTGIYNQIREYTRRD